VERFGQAQAPALQEQVARALVNKGDVLGLLGSHTEAIKAYSAALAHNPAETVSAMAGYGSAVALFTLNRWDNALQVLDDALARFPQEHDQRKVTPADAGLRLLLTSLDVQTWPERITTLLVCYDQHDTLASLGRGLVQSIMTWSAPMVSNTAAQTWRDIWQEHGGGYDALTIPLRLLDAAVRYRETHDQRVLLRLPMEERKVLEQILGEGSPGTA
jgi:tetratricopeptide (TPR) repeat protein